MEIFLECWPCLLRQVLEASGLATDSEAVRTRVMEAAVRVLSDHAAYRRAPELCARMHRTVRQITGVADPYAAVKQRDIASALRHEARIRSFAGDRPERILKASATGNVMDSALDGDPRLAERLDTELHLPFSGCGPDRFLEELAGARSVLIIGDNAGEVVFDKPLAEWLSAGRDVRYAVRSGPILNDATEADARQAGMDAQVPILSTGCAMPGAVPEHCGRPFLDWFRTADIVISKGQGNYEALSDADRPVWFLLKAKCARIAGSLDVPQGAYVFRRGGRVV